MAGKRVFITGLGCVTPCGNNKDDFWEALIHGRSGVGRLTILDLTDLPITIGGEVKGLDFSQANINDKVNERKMDRSSVFAVVASKEAIGDAGLQPEHLGSNCGVIIGSGLSGLITLQEQTENLLNKGPRSVSVFTIPMLMPNAGVANVSLAFNLRGTAYNVASACSSSGHALIDAYEVLHRGEAEVILGGGAECCITRLAISAFANMKAMTKKFNDNPTAASRPFDAGRDGFVMSEGACMMVLETEEHMKRRGAKPYAEIIGYGATMDSHHLVQPDPEATGAIEAIRRAVKMAGINPSEIAAETYVNAHGTSTKFNDAAETRALKEIFGESARKLQISSTKSITGHMVGAACAVEMAACMLAFKRGILPPTINYETPDADCDLDYIPNKSREANVRYAINNTFGFGGHNVCMIVKKPD